MSNRKKASFLLLDLFFYGVYGENHKTMGTHSTLQSERKSEQNKASVFVVGIDIRHYTQAFILIDINANTPPRRNDLLTQTYMYICNMRNSNYEVFVSTHIT